MDEFIGKEIDAFCPINLFDLKVIPTFDIKRDRVCTLIHDVCVYLEVYVHMIAHVSTRCNICVHMLMRVSRLDSYAHAVYDMMNDAESLD